MQPMRLYPRYDRCTGLQDYSRLFKTSMKTSMSSSYFFVCLRSSPLQNIQNRRLHHPRLRFVFGHLRVLPTLWPLWHRLGRLGHVPCLAQLKQVKTGQKQYKHVCKISWFDDDVDLHLKLFNRLRFCIYFLFVQFVSVCSFGCIAGYGNTMKHMYWNVVPFRPFACRTQDCFVAHVSLLLF